MDLKLSEDEVGTLRALLHDYLPELRFEVARTNAVEIRHLLVRRQVLCEQLLEQLQSEPSGTPPDAGVRVADERPRVPDDVSSLND